MSITFFQTPQVKRSDDPTPRYDEDETALVQSVKEPDTACEFGKKREKPAACAEEESSSEEDEVFVTYSRQQRS